MESLNTSGFTGTSKYYRFSPLTRAVLTDGSKYVAEKKELFGLMQDIAIDCLKPKIKDALQNGLVVVKVDTEDFGLKYEDGNYNKIYGYKLYNYPKFKGEFFINLLDENQPVIYLPSEY